MPRQVLIPLIVACALFLQNLDSTVLSTSLPAIAEALGEPPLRLHLALTSYLLSLAVFLPLSGWAADRFGARTVFCGAILLFTAASVACGFASSLGGFIAARVVQGAGGAMMVPVGRLILLRSVPKSQLVAALAWLTMPALIGPVIGPPLGGFLTTYASWRWIFWINIPIGILGILLALLFIEDVREPDVGRFDALGFLLSGVGLAATLFGIDMATSEALPLELALPCMLVGLAALALYVAYSRRAEHPILDLGLLRIRTFLASIIGGSLFRIGVGALPFLLPLMLQTGFGYTAFESGLVTFASAVGAMGMKALAVRILNSFGFRAVLTWNALLAAAFIAACALFRPSTPYLVMISVLFVGGVFRSLQFTSVNAIGFADVSQAQMSQATTLSSVAQQLSLSMGVAVAALVLHHGRTGPGVLAAGDFPLAFVVVAVISASSAWIYSRLSSDAGSELAGRAAAPSPSAPGAPEGDETVVLEPEGALPRNPSATR